MDIKKNQLEEDLQPLCTLIKALMINEACSIEQLAELTGLSDGTLKRILSGDSSDTSVGIFLNIVQALHCKLQIKKDDVIYDMDKYIYPHKMEINECPKCHQPGKTVGVEHNNSEVETSRTIKRSLLGTVTTITESENRSYYSALLVPPDSMRYSDKTYIIKKKLYEAMMVCKECNLLFDNVRKKSVNCDALGYERMLSTASISKIL